MQRPANPGKLHRLRKLRAWLVTAVLALAGCTHSQNPNATIGDPLLGQFQPPPPPATASAPATTPAQGSALQPIPQNTGLNTNAALASQTPQPQSLKITQGSGWARKIDGAGAAPTPGIPVSQPRVEPIPKDTITAPSSPAIKQTGGWTAAPPSTTPLPTLEAKTTQPATPLAAPPTADELEQKLKSRGVKAHEQVREGNNIRLTVVVENPANPNSVDSLYTIAPDYPSAVEAIVREIDAKRAHP